MASQTVSFFTEYMPHGHCYNWLPSILWSSVIADGLIAAAYFSIPIALFTYIHKKKNVEFHGTALLFCGFILLCGITHVFGIFTIWYGNYGWHTIFKALTAVFSFATAAVLFIKLPLALSMPTKREFEQIHGLLVQEKIERVRLEAKNETQKELQPTLNRLDRVLDSVNDGLWEWNTHTDQVWFSESMKVMLNLTSDQQGQYQDWRNHIHPDDIASVEDAVKQHINIKTPYDIMYRGLTPKGHYEWFHSRGVLKPSISEDTTYMAGITTNVHNARNTAEELQQKSMFLSRVLNNVACGVGVLHADLNDYSFVNLEFTAITGYSLVALNAIITQNGLYSLFHPDDISSIQNHFSALLQTPEKTQYIEYRFQHQDQRWIWIQQQDIAYVDQPGQPLEVLSAIFDISHNKLNKQQLEDSNKSLERFAYAASHDLQEPLRKICAFSQRLAKTFQHNHLLDAQGEFELNRITDAAKRMSTMITSLLNLSRINPYDIRFEWCQLGDLLAATQESLSLLIEETNAIIECHQDCECYVDPHCFQQLLQNLLANSIHYRRENTVPHITITISQHPQHWTLCVADNGIGIPKQSNIDVFSTFKRLNSKSSGYGMGLAICEQVVKAHQGQISVNPEITLGTEILIQLPLDRVQQITRSAL